MGQGWHKVNMYVYNYVLEHGIFFFLSLFSPHSSFVSAFPIRMSEDSTGQILATGTQDLAALAGMILYSIRNRVELTET